MMKHVITASLLAFTAACAPEAVSVASAGEEAPITPEVSELGISVGQTGLAELRGKVSGRNDATCDTTEIGEVCTISTGNELYVFTNEGSTGHPAAMFRGFVKSEDGAGVEFQQRGWFAGEEASAREFYAAVEEAKILPVRPE